MLPEKSINEFAKIYEKRFGEELSNKEATEKATRLFNLYEAVLTSTSFKNKANKNRDAPRNKNH